MSKRTFLTLEGEMVRPTRAPAALSIIASSLVALGVVAAGVQIGEGDLARDPRSPSPILTRPAAQLVVPIQALEPPLVDQFLSIASAPSRQPITIPVLAPGPQSVPVPGPSPDDSTSPLPTPTPAPTDPVIAPIPGLDSPLPPPDETIVNPLVGVIEGLLGPAPASAGAEEAGTEAPTSPISGLLGL